jgi:hypothetical protein
MVFIFTDTFTYFSLLPVLNASCGELFVIELILLLSTFGQRVLAANHLNTYGVLFMYDILEKSSKF